MHTAAETTRIFLLVTSADYPLVHHIFLPARDVQRRPYTFALPYRARTTCSRRRPAPAELTPPARRRRVRAPRRRRHRPPRLRPRRVAHDLDALRFNPWNTGGGMEPAGWLNDARDRAYKLSQGAWHRTRRKGAALQDSADRELARRELTAVPTIEP